MTRIEILTIGDELVEGRLVDTNSAWVSHRLAAEGMAVARHTSIGDDRDEIVAALREVASRSTAVLVSGGLGPTTDDLTAECAGEAFLRPLRRDPAALEHVQQFFSSRGREMSPNNQKQADLPDGSVLLPNPNGTAVGFQLEADGCLFFFMPGVPRELMPMLETSVLPQVRGRVPSIAPQVATLKLFGIGESDVGHRLEGIGKDVPPPARLTIQYRATFPENHVRLVLEGLEPDQGHQVLDSLIAEARERLGRWVFAEGHGCVETTFAEVVAAEARRTGARVALVEGCSGGRAAHLMSLVEGTESLLAGSLTATAAEVVTEVLGLQPSQLAGNLFGAELTEAMARAARQRFGATHGVAVTGVVSEQEATQKAPAGTLWVSASGPRGVIGRRLFFPIDRERLRELAAYAVLAVLRRSLAGNQ